MTAEEILRQLLKNFYVDFHGELEWSYLEGVSIRDIEGVEFEQELLPYLDDSTARRYRAGNTEEVD